MNYDPRGTILQQGNLLFLHYGLIEEVSCSNQFFSEILVSYSVRENNTTSIQNIRLNLNQKTLVLDDSGQMTCLCCLRPGMWITAIFSAQMTRSNPPQANAFLVAVQQNPQSSDAIQRPMPFQQPERNIPTQMPPQQQRPNPPEREVPFSPIAPQMPIQSERPTTSQRTPTRSRPYQSQMPGWSQNNEQTQMPNWSQNNEQPQMPNWSQNNEQPQMPGWSQNNEQPQMPNWSQNNEQT